VNPFTVDWDQPALDSLADIWMQAADRWAVTQAQTAAERRLARDPIGGTLASEGLYRLVEPPLTLLYEVDPQRRVVLVTGVLASP
jgi:hypothetical protein